MHNDTVVITESQILENWKRWGVEHKIPVKAKGALKPHHLTPIKTTNARNIWRIDVPTIKGDFPLIVKVNKGTPFATKQKEWLIFKYFKDTELKEFLPDIYDIQTCDEDETWVFMECLNRYTKVTDFTVDHLYAIVCRVAQLHAATFEHQPVARLISASIHGFQSEERTHHLKMLKDYLELAKEDAFLKPLIDHLCPELYELVELDLDFPEVIRSGRCLNHGDLHIGNICYDNDNQIKFIDFSAATYSSCWLDVVKSIEFMIDHHPEWGIPPDCIRKKAIRLYLHTMKKEGVVFNEDSDRLYRLAYIMTVFEKELRRHLKFILQGETRYIFPEILKKISRFSKELHLLE